jgi:hypothetical protein
MLCRTIPPLLLLVAGLIAGPAHASTSPACAAQLKEVAPAALELEYTQFEKQNGKGFHLLAEKGCHQEAGDLIEQYMGRNKNTPVFLHWHLAQMRAMAGQKEEAIKHARATLWSEAAASGQGFKWNDYVLGTIAFLEGDKAKLIEHRDRVGSHARMNKGNITNVIVLNQLVDNFGKSYKDALAPSQAK